MARDAELRIASAMPLSRGGYMTSVCEARAPAKVILLGEHWVVHGGKALAAAVGLYAKVRCRSIGGGSVVVSSPALGVTEELPSRCERLCNLAAALQYISSRYGLEGAYCEIDSSVPPGAGLGSSAAVAVAFSAAYLCLRKGSISKDVVNQAAYEAEKVAHGKPSGIDNTVSTYGGFIVYRKGAGFRAVSPRQGKGLNVVIIDSGVQRSTRQAVERFTHQLIGLGGLGPSLVALNDRLVAEALKALNSGEKRHLGNILYLSHGLLKGMGVSISRLDYIVEEARRLGAYGAKLSGAGLGGIVIALTDRDIEEALREELARKGYRLYSATLGAPGVEAVRIGPRPDQAA